MNPITYRRISLSALLGTCLLAPAVACANSDNVVEDAFTADGGSADVFTSIETDAAKVEPEVPDASTQAGDAQARTCSEDGVCHTALPPQSWLRDVWSAGDGVVWAVGWNDRLLTDASGVILRWDGAAWAVHYKDAKRIHAVWGSSPTDIWVGGDSGLFHGTGPSSAAITWNKVRNEPVTSIWGSGANDVWAVGSTKTHVFLFDGKVLHYSGPGADGADGWEIDPISSRPVAFRKVWGTSASDVWIGGNEASDCGPFCSQGTHAITLRRRPDGDGGFTWSQASLPEFGGVGNGSDFTGGGSITPDHVWLMGNESTDWFTSYDVLFTGTSKSDGSADFDWQQGTFGTCRGYSPCQGLWYSRAVWGKNPDDAYLAGDFGQLRHWNGTRFSFVKTTIEKIPLTANLYAMWGTSNTDLWIVGDRIALHKVSLSQP